MASFSSASIKKRKDVKKYRFPLPMTSIEFGNPMFLARLMLVTVRSSMVRFVTNVNTFE